MASNQNKTLPKLLSVYKPKGLTPLQTLNLLREKFPQYQDEKLSYAGRLDPLASGVMLVLVGEGNFEREKYLSLPKVYQAEILLGVSTDTGDVMGLVQEVASSQIEITEEKLLTVLQSQIRSFTQEYPQFSSPKIAGASGLAREVEIINITLNPVGAIALDQLVDQVIENVSRVVGNFRQADILKRWDQVREQLPTQLPLISITVTTGSGVYVRSLAERVGKELDSPALAYTIKRLSVGEYTIDTALRLE